MFAALAEGGSHPAVAAWLAIATAGVAAVVVAMAWSVNARQIRLAEQLARRQFLVTGEIAARTRGRENDVAGVRGPASVGGDSAGMGGIGQGGAGPGGAGPGRPGQGRAGQGRAGTSRGATSIEATGREELDAAAREKLEAAACGAAEEVARGAEEVARGAAGGSARGRTQPARPAPETATRVRAQGAARGKRVPPEVIDGPEEVVAGEQARYRVQSSGPHQVVTWAVGGGPVSHAPDPGHPDDLLLIADQPGELTIIARVREGLTERRATKSVTAVPDVTTVTPPFTLRLFLHGWGLVVVAVLIVGFAGALDALGNFTSSDFIALAVPLAALLGVIAVARGHGEPAGRPANGKRHPLG